MKLTLAISPCPNDTFIFHAWIAGLVPAAPELELRLADIDELNGLVVAGTPDVAKMSFAAFAHVRDRYALLHAGGALGRGCGPLVVVRAGSSAATRQQGLDGARIAIPGDMTTAAMLLRLFLAEKKVQRAAVQVLRFDQIMPAVAAGRADAGVVIHESRFTYPAYGLAQLVDLGQWWEETTTHPIPLGGIVVRRDLGKTVAAAAERAVRESLLLARRDPSLSVSFIKENAQEMDDDVCRQHIDLYVNDYSLDYGKQGRTAIEELLSRAVRAGTGTPTSDDAPLFWDE